MTGQNGTVAVLSVDYPAAAERLVTCTNKFVKGRNNKAIDTWVNHWVSTAGSTYESNIQFFLNCKSGDTSAHFNRLHDGRDHGSSAAVHHPTPRARSA